jgi:hypothetical protein
VGKKVLKRSPWQPLNRGSQRNRLRPLQFRIHLNLNLNLMLMFPTSGFVIQPSIGVLYGF